MQNSADFFLIFSEIPLFFPAASSDTVGEGLAPPENAVKNRYSGRTKGPNGRTQGPNGWTQGPPLRGRRLFYPFVFPITGFMRLPCFPIHGNSIYFSKRNN